MRKAERLFQLVNLIRAHQPVTAQTLAERLEVTVRSIYRYVDDLSASGVPVYGEAGKGYSMHDNYELPPLNLTNAELQALKLAVTILSRASGHSLSSSALSLQAKLEAVVATSRLHADSSTIFAMTPKLDPISSGHWDTLRQAIDATRQLEISYTCLQNQASQRRILPLGLFYWGNKWTLGAWCELRQDYRDFRLDRITQITVLESALASPTGINLARYLQAQATK